MSISPVTPQKQNNTPIDSAQAIRVLIVIRVAMIFGLLFFMGMVLTVFDITLQFRIDFMEIMAIVTAVIALVGFMMSGWFLTRRPILGDQELTNEDKKQLLIQIIMSSEIVKCAILESAAFFGITISIVDESGIGMIIAILMLVILVVTFPTSGRFQNKLENLRHQHRC